MWRAQVCMMKANSFSILLIIAHSVLCYDYTFIFWFMFNFVQFYTLTTAIFKIPFYNFNSTIIFSFSKNTD